MMNVAIDRDIREDTRRGLLRSMAEDIASEVSELPECGDWEDEKELINELALQLLNYILLEDQRRTRKARQAEGIARAKAEGVQFGPKPGPLPEQFTDAYERWENGDVSMAAAARQCGMPLSTFRKAAKSREARADA